MNYNDKKIAITGHTGFLGSNLRRVLLAAGARVRCLDGDVRDSQTFEPVDYDTDMLFHFGAPSSQIMFQREPDYAIDVTVNGMRQAIKACERSGAKLIFPSTGLLSLGGSNEYARGKMICEDLQAGAQCDNLGLRIFGTYGPGEAAKRDYASVPFLFMQELRANRAPVIYGDGSQERDYIYIEDTVNAIIRVAEIVSGGTIDIGSGEPISLKVLVDKLITLLGVDLTPTYIPKPANYIDASAADTSRMDQYYTRQYNLDDGLQAMIEATA